MVRVYLFGPPRCERDGVPVHIGRRLTTALNAYLFAAGQPVSRETLAALFWPEYGQAAALKNLRRELARLRRDLGGEVVAATRAHLAIDPAAGAWADVPAFRAHLDLVRQHAHFPETDCAACRQALAHAADLYSGDFMAGFSLPHSPEFDDWQRFQQESLRDGLGQALRRLAAWHAARRHDDRAIAFARRWLALDPLDEAARRALMRVYVSAGQQAAAVRLYDEGARLLHDELGIEPAEATTELWQTIRDGRTHQLAPGPQPAPGPQYAPPAPRDGAASHRRTNLARPPTPFVGRLRELAMIQLRLQEPACRLLTLVGSGGIGKTRLAIEVGQVLLRRPTPLFSHGIFFVPLASVESTRGMVSAVVNALSVPLNGSLPFDEQLLAFLQGRQLLLILDNLEHLPGAESVVESILSAAPGVRILGTSRAPLRLREEWVHPLEGLSVPPARRDPADDDAVGRADLRARTYDAIRLFENRARAVTPAFLLEDELEEVIRICRLVEGMPLALELAAAWLRVLDTGAIADQLEDSLDLLSGRIANMPERHRSIRAVFDQTWGRLSPVEQAALARLSVFRGGFDRDAAASVAGATLFVLSSLVEKSLVVVAGTRRYRLHELLRQFAAEQLETMGLIEQTRTTHSRHFLSVLAEIAPALKRAGQKEVMAIIHGDLDNFRLAWEWSLEQGDVPAVDGALDGLFLYFSVSGRNREGSEFLRAAARRFASPAGEPPGRLWARMTARVAMLVGYMERDAAVDAELETALAVAERHGDDAELAFCWLARGFLHGLYGDALAGAIESYERALAIYRQLDEPYYEMQVLLWLGFAHGNLSDLDQFFAYANEALAIGRAADCRAAVAQVLSNLAAGAFCVGDYQAAEAYAQEVHALASDLDLLGTLVHTKTQLSLVALLKGELEQSKQLAADATALAHDINHPLYTANYLSLYASLTGDYAEGLRLAMVSRDAPMPRFGMVKVHWALALVHAGLGNNGDAWRHAVTMIDMAHESGYVGMLTWALPVAAVVLARTGEAERAVELLGLAGTHPLSPPGWQSQWSLLDTVQRDLHAALGATAFDAAWARGAALDLADVVAVILCEETAAVQC